MAERYQWTQGPFNGTIETVNCEDDNYVYFDSGRRCQKQNMSYMMFQTTDAEETGNFNFGGSLNSFEDEINFGGGKDYTDAGVKIDIPDEFKEEVATTPMVSQSANTTNIAVEQPKVVEDPKVEESPVAKLLNMQKDDSLVLDRQMIALAVKWPTKEFITILLNTFDKEIVLKELSEFIIKQVDVKYLVGAIKEDIADKLNKICEIND